MSSKAIKIFRARNDNLAGYFWDFFYYVAHKICSVLNPYVKAMVVLQTTSESMGKTGNKVWKLVTAARI